MKTFFRLSLTAIAFLLFSGAFAATETKAQPLREALKRMDAHNKALTSLRANIEMQKYNAQLEDADIPKKGKVIYLPQKGRNAYVRIDWTTPVVESLAVIDKEYMIYTASTKQAIVGKVNDAKGSGKSNNALAFLNMSKTQLQANYEISYIGQENVNGGIATWHIELKPKNATNYKVADLWIDKDGMPIMAKVTESNNDTTTILLSNVEKNITINGSVFKINLPEGTKIIKG